uniref:Uncharacterized protein n=1 Tax=Klebsiella pneumoniae TaxID=573 RepID=A0A2H5CP82_KLEPN|nr:hypothetical protein [Klebsiella pneumoniae]
MAFFYILTVICNFVSEGTVAKLAMRQPFVSFSEDGCTERQKPTAL